MDHFKKWLLITIIETWVIKNVQFWVINPALKNNQGPKTLPDFPSAIFYWWILWNDPIFKSLGKLVSEKKMYSSKWLLVIFESMGKNRDLNFQLYLQRSDHKILLILVLSSVFPDLLQAIPVSIHVNIILFSMILVVLTMVGTAFFMYNAFGKPFETLHGPLGLYLVSFISGKYKILPSKSKCFFNVSKDALPKCSYAMRTVIFL